MLDVGTGSGYQAAVLAELAAEVVTIERIPELADEARARLREAGYAERRGARRATARSASPSARRSTRSRSRPPLRASRTRSTTSSRTAAGSSFRAARAAARSSCSSCDTRGAASSAASISVPLRSAPRRRRVWRMTDRMGDGDESSARLPCDDRGVLAAPRSTPDSRPHACERACASARTGSSSRSSASSARAGYLVNLAVYAVPLDVVGLHYISAADRLVPRRGHEQLHVEPPVDVPGTAGRRRVPGHAVLHRLDRRAGREPGRPAQCSSRSGSARSSLRRSRSCSSRR